MQETFARTKIPEFIGKNAEQIQKINKEMRMFCLPLEYSSIGWMYTYKDFLNSRL